MLVFPKRDEEESEEGYAASLGRELIYSGLVGNKLVTFLWENLLRAGTKLDDDAEKAKDKRRLFLNSMGGDVGCMASIVDLFEEVSDLSTVATGACMSAAVPIIAAGSPGKRYATHRTRFMIHPGYTTYDHRLELPKMAAETEEMRECERLYARIMARYCRHTYDWWYRKGLSNKPWYFDAQTAVEHGIIDKVLPDQSDMTTLRKRKK